MPIKTNNQLNNQPTDEKIFLTLDMWAQKNAHSHLYVNHMKLDCSMLNKIHNIHISTCTYILLFVCIHKYISSQNKFAYIYISVKIYIYMYI